ncbi:MAG: hypothetical protein Q9167_003766 [Letrouitia subvulpina]
MLTAFHRASSRHVALSWDLSKSIRLLLPARCLQTKASVAEDVPFRKQYKDDLKRRHKAGANGLEGDEKHARDLRLEKWELTVGIEIHAQLNTRRKLFSKAFTSVNDQPNSHVSVFDLALPGSQPEFQKATLIPALRAAIALGCNIQHESRFDRKHYFYADQPSGYQITQYYRPFARDGAVSLYNHDGIASQDGTSIIIGIKQIQLEQDTAKSIQQPPSTTLLDFNRVSHPLIEIITLPHIHHPQTAAACVRKLQGILQAVNAVTTGMEQGGMRADVNVSVRPKKGSQSSDDHITTNLGQRTEIKNLSSLKAVEDAIVAERDRQIDLLEAGGIVVGETRGWTLGSTETVKLRGKEGEVDYRYMPDPDLGPLIIGDSLIEHVQKTLPELPEKTIGELVSEHELTIKDARTLVDLEDGARLDYFDAVLEELNSILTLEQVTVLKEKNKEIRKLGVIVANWVIHELGGLLTKAEMPFAPRTVPANSLASIIQNLLAGRVTGKTAKQLLAMVFGGDTRDVSTIIREDNLGLQHLSQEEYKAVAQRLMDENVEMVKQIKEKGQVQKIKWLVGQMMRLGKGKIVAEKAEAALKDLLLPIEGR